MPRPFPVSVSTSTSSSSSKTNRSSPCVSASSLGKTSESAITSFDLRFTHPHECGNKSFAQSNDRQSNSLDAVDLPHSTEEESMAPKYTLRLVKKISVDTKDASHDFNTDKSPGELYGPGVIVIPDVPNVPEGWVIIKGSLDL